MRIIHLFVCTRWYKLSNADTQMIIFGSVYFTAKILVATDWLKLLCRQSKIRSRGMTQFE